MALPIKETPILYGKDAEKFRKEREKNTISGSVSKEDYVRAQKVYDDILEKRIMEAYDAVLTHDLKPNTIICSICGNVYSIKDNKKALCQHMKDLLKDILQD